MVINNDLSEYKNNLACIVRFCDEYSYPGQQIIENGGIPRNTIFNYVASSFLDGIVNYLKDPRYFLINQYGISDKYTEADYARVAAAMSKTFHTRLMEKDSALVFGQSDTSVYFLWYDRDSSDCNIWRFDKELIDLDNFIEQRLAMLREYYGAWAHTDYEKPLIVEFEAGGWVRA